jgi:hypothetical protein
MTISCDKFEDHRSYEQSAYIKASNPGARDSFGFRMAWWRDTLAVSAVLEASGVGGMHGDQEDDSAPESGAVYMFRHDGATELVEAEPTGWKWTQQAYIKASNPASGDRFGNSLSLHVNLMAVGAPHENSLATGVGGDETLDDAIDSGAAYVFQRVENEWRQDAFIKASNTDAGDRFGYSVSVWGDALAVGAPGEDGRAAGVDGDQAACCTLDSGAVYVFRRINETWRQEAYIKAADPGSGDGLGWSVALYWNTLAVGAPGKSGVYVFRRWGSSWQQEAYMRGTHAGPGDDFGASVALRATDVLAVGAPSEDESGAVYVFYDHPREGWQQDAHIEASNADPDDLFGYSVALSGRILAVGAMGEASAARDVDGDREDDSAPSSGAVYVFRRDGEQWELQGYLKARNGGIDSYFGSGLALSEEGAVAVGASGESSAAMGIDGDPFDHGVAGSGAVYVFDGL